MFPDLALWHDTRRRSAAEQMAADEVIFHHATLPVLRIYCWTAPALSFGYPQALADVLPLAAGRDVVRRWTGGGVVFHGDDLTLALALPRTAEAASWRACDVYARLHAALAAVLESRGTAASVVGSGRCGGELECFRAPVTHDLVQGEKKILGGAMRRTRDGLLYQGSLQGVDLPAPAAVAAALCARWSPLGDTPAFEDEIQRLAAGKYGTPEWTNAR